MLAEWDPYSMPMLTEVAGVVKFGDIHRRRHHGEQLDEVTGLSRKVIIESTGPGRTAAHQHQG